MFRRTQLLQGNNDDEWQIHPDDDGVIVEEWPDDERTDRNSELESNPESLPPPPPPPPPESSSVLLFEALSVEMTELEYNHHHMYEKQQPPYRQHNHYKHQNKTTSTCGKGEEEEGVVTVENDDIEQSPSQNSSSLSFRNRKFGSGSNSNNNNNNNNSCCGNGRCCYSPRHRRIVELYTSPDYWSVWYGLVLYGIANALVFVVVPINTNNNNNNNESTTTTTTPDSSNSKRLLYVIPQPMIWSTSNPFDAWDVYGLVGTILLLSVLGFLYLVALHCMGKLTPPKPPKHSPPSLPLITPTNLETSDERAVTTTTTTATTTTNEPQPSHPTTTTTTSLSRITTKSVSPRSVTAKYMYGYIFICVIATISLWLGSNQWCSQNGLGYAVFAIFLGVLITNTPRIGNHLMDHYIGLTAADGEFFIKCSLVLLAVQFNELIDVGVPGMVVAWVGSPLSIIFGFLVGTRLMHCDATVVILIAVGASWCGASAISAVAPIIAASSEQVSLAVSVVSFFTLGFTFIQPYIAIAVGMPDDIAGAWIGGSIDQTGNVIVSAAIISEEATEVAGIVKMVLNAGLGVMASVIACWWYSRKALPYDDKKDDDDEDNDGSNRKKFSLITLWDKFPKFTIGFIITSTLLTVTMQRIEGTPEAIALPRAIAALNRWLFAISFVGIGLTTNIAKLWDKAIKSGIIPVYLVVNMFDILIALGLAYLVY